MGRAEQNLKRNLKILKALDKAIKDGKWEGKLIFQAAGKKLREMRDRLRHQLNRDEDLTSKRSHIAKRIAKRTGQFEIFVSLYNADGDDIKKWAMVIKSLGTSVITRPIYNTEIEIQTLIRSKITKQNEAYLVVYINKTDLLAPSNGNAPRDRLGHEMLMVKEGALDLHNITRFVHISSEYKFIDNTLEKI